MHYRSRPKSLASSDLGPALQDARLPRPRSPGVLAGPPGGLEDALAKSALLLRLLAHELPSALDVRVAVFKAAEYALAWITLASERHCATLLISD